MTTLIVIFGLSGSGKSTAARILEDNEIRVIRNLPPSLLLELATREHQTASVIFPETNNADQVKQTLLALDELRQRTIPVTEIFLDASDEVLIDRYKESRRPHPLKVGVSVLEAIHIERTLLLPLRQRAHHLIQSDNLAVSQLKDLLLNCVELKSKRKLSLAFLSFGFKYGVPAEIDLCFDVRFLDNPFFVKELKEGTGLDEDVRRFVLERNETGAFLEQVNQLLDFLLPLYLREGKNYLTVGIGCTGGRHRSVVIANALSERPRGEKFTCSLMHRDLMRRASA